LKPELLLEHTVPWQASRDSRPVWRRGSRERAGRVWQTSTCRPDCSRTCTKFHVGGVADPPDPHVLGLLDPDPDSLVRDMDPDPDPDPDPSIIKQKK
jgi:hypothetical protein